MCASAFPLSPSRVSQQDAAQKHADRNVAAGGLGILSSLCCLCTRVCLCVLSGVYWVRRRRRRRPTGANFQTVVSINNMVETRRHDDYTATTTSSTLMAIAMALATATAPAFTPEHRQRAQHTQHTTQIHRECARANEYVRVLRGGGVCWSPAAGLAWGVPSTVLW